MIRVIILVTFITIACYINSAGQNSTGMPSGNIGIGTSSPATRLHVHEPNAVTVVGNVAEVFRASDYYGPQFKFLFHRHTSGSDWLGMASRLQFATSDVKQAYIEFNPAGGNPAALAFGADNIERMRILANGDIGIGRIDPQSKMHIYGGNLGTNANDKIKILQVENGCGSDLANIEFYSYRNANGNSWFTTSTRIQNQINGSYMGFIEFNPPGMLQGMALGTGGAGQLYINSSGQMGVGTTNINDPAYKLFVETGIRMRKVKVDQTGWPDYVFQPAYRLRPLYEVEKYIQQHGHLPEVPSAAEVEKEGLDLRSGQAVLLKKIEELTLYIIQQQKEVEELKLKCKVVDELKKEIVLLKQSSKD